MTHHAPVQAVGGQQQDGGPWPDDLEEIAVDDRLQRPVTIDGETRQVEVVVSDIKQHIDQHGNATDGYSVGFHVPGGL